MTYTGAQKAAITDAITMELSEQEAIAYIQSESGFEMSTAAFAVAKHRYTKQALANLHEHGLKTGENYLKRIDTARMIRRQLWTAIKTGKTRMPDVAAAKVILESLDQEAAYEARSARVYEHERRKYNERRKQTK